MPTRRGAGGKKYVQWIIYETGRILMKTAFIGTAEKKPGAELGNIMDEMIGSLISK